MNYWLLWDAISVRLNLLLFISHRLWCLFKMSLVDFFSQGEIIGCSPVTSSAENSFRAECPSSLPLVSVSVSVSITTSSPVKEILPQTIEHYCVQFTTTLSLSELLLISLANKILSTSTAPLVFKCGHHTTCSFSFLVSLVCVCVCVCVLFRISRLNSPIWMELCAKGEMICLKAAALAHRRQTMRKWQVGGISRYLG